MILCLSAETEPNPPFPAPSLISSHALEKCVHWRNMMSRSQLSSKLPIKHTASVE